MDHKAEVCRKWIAEYSKLRPWDAEHTLRAKITTIIGEMVDLNDEYEVEIPQDIEEFSF